MDDAESFCEKGRKIRRISLGLCVLESFSVSADSSGRELSEPSKEGQPIGFHSALMEVQSTGPLTGKAV
jgi:hypothetical protein